MDWLVLCTKEFFGPVASACHALGLVAGLPAYEQFRRTHATKAPIEEGSWADLNLPSNALPPPMYSPTFPCGSWQ